MVYKILIVCLINLKLLALLTIGQQSYLSDRISPHEFFLTPEFWYFDTHRVASIDFEMAAAVLELKQEAEMAPSGTVLRDEVKLQDSHEELLNVCMEPGCLFFTDSVFEMEEHKKSHQDNGFEKKDSLYCCKFCPYKTAHRQSISVHKRIHNGERPFKCEWPDCDYAAATKSTLQSHMRTHTGERPYKCNKCKYAAAQIATLNGHKRKHI